MKRLLFLTIVLIAALTAAAQTAESDVRAKIKEVKLSGQYVFAESGSMNAKKEDLRLLVVDALYVQVAEDMAALGKTKEEIAEARKLAEIHHSVLEFSNGSLNKAFAYVSKEVFEGKLLANNKKSDEGKDKPTEDVVVPTDTTHTEPKEPVVPSENKYVIDDSDSIPTVIDPVDSDTTLVAVTDTLTKPKPKVEPVQPQPVKLTEPVKPSEPVEPVLPEKHQRVVNEILALDTYEGVMLYLDAMKDDGRLMYGSISKLIKPEEAYMIIIKDSKLVTVLGQGSGNRLNLRTQQPDLLNNYKGHSVIWMKIYR